MEQEIREELENRRITNEVDSSDNINENENENYIIESEIINATDSELINESVTEPMNVSTSEQESAINESEPKIVSNEPIKKKYHKKKYDGSNIFAKMWHSFFDVFDFQTRSSEKVAKAYLSVALLISFISMFHVQGLFALVNETFLSWAIAISIELAVIVSLFSLKMLERVSAWMIWLLIGSLFFVQALGNTFSAYIWFSTKGTVYHELFVQMINMFGADPNSIGLRRIVSVILGGLFPFFAFLMVKSTSEYLDNSDDTDYEWDDSEDE